jgi:hypothetical protein
MMGDGGARLLAKALQINTKLKNLVFDRNNISLQGYSEIAYALERYKIFFWKKLLFQSFDFQQLHAALHAVPGVWRAAVHEDVRGADGHRDAPHPRTHPPKRHAKAAVPQPGAPPPTGLFSHNIQGVSSHVFHPKKAFFYLFLATISDKKIKSNSIYYLVRQENIQ